MAGPTANISLMDKLKTAIEGRWGLAGLFAAAFLESSFIPFPLEVLLIPAILWQRDRAWLIASTVLGGCITASIVFYAIGSYLFDTMGGELVAWLSLDDELRTFERDLSADGFWLIASISLFPLPLQVATLGSGALNYPFLPFLAAIALTRGIRFFGLTLLVLAFGQATLRLVEGWHPAVTAGLVVASLLTVGGIYWAM